MDTPLSTSRKQRTERSGKRSGIDLSTTVYGKVPPQAKELEEVVIGAILLEKHALDNVADILRPECFYVETHRMIYQAIMNLSAKSQPIDLMTVAEELLKEGNLETIGGAYQLTKLTNSVVSSANIETHARIILQKHIRRELIRVSGEIMTQAWDESTDDLEVLELAEKAIMEVGTNYMASATISIDSAMVQAIQKIEEWRNMDSSITGVPSGFSQLDKATRGWQPESFIILAARPSVGKTAFALNLIRNAAINPIRPTPVAVWSLEMSVVELVLRMLAAESDVLLHKIQTGRLRETDLVTIYEKGVSKLSNAKIFFDDSDHVTISAFRAKARRLKKKHDIGLIVVDYLQLMSGDNERGNREQEISYISRSMKRLAKELRIPIIALSQMSRDFEKRTGAAKKPQLSDLRESGAIEQDADVVMFLWRPSDEEVADNADLAFRRYLRIAKQRGGGLDTIELDFKNEIQLFKAIDDQLPHSFKPVQLNLAGEPDSDLPF